MLSTQFIPSWPWHRTRHTIDPLVPEGFTCYNGSLLLTALAINVLSLALPVMTLQVYDRILPNPGAGTLSVLIFGVCCAVILEMILRLSRSYMIGRTSATYEHRMACLALSKVLHADISKVSGGVGEHLHQISSVSTLKEFYNGHALTTLAELAFVPLALLLISYIAGWVVAIPIIVIALFSICAMRNGLRLRCSLHVREQCDDIRFNFLVETLDGIHTIKSMALEPYFERRYEAMEDDSVQANYAVTQDTACMFNTGAIFSHIMVTSVITGGAWAVLEGALTTGSLIATLLLSGRVMQPVHKTLALWTRYQEYQLARVHMQTLLATPQHQKDTYVTTTPTIREGRLDVQNVQFSFAETGKLIIADASLSLQPGKTMLLSGEHGCGKTTLLKLIAGIFPTPCGTVHVDGQLLEKYASHDLTKHIGFIRSQPEIFRGTIRDNITAFGLIPEAQAREVAALLHVDHDIAGLPGGFDTFLSGSDIDNIPLGLKQRIAIVRALANKPRLILYDNADRALDKDGYTSMYQLLGRLKGKATMVLVSDDQNIRSLADEHYVLQDGVLVRDTLKGLVGSVMPYQELYL